MHVFKKAASYINLFLQSLPQPQGGSKVQGKTKKTHLKQAKITNEHISAYVTT